MTEPLALSVSSWIMPIGGLAEIFLMLWLLVKGVDVRRWRAERTARPAA